MYIQSERKTVWILIRWFCQKPADRDLQCFQKRINPDCAGERVYLQNNPFHSDRFSQMY